MRLASCRCSIPRFSWAVTSSRLPESACQKELRFALHLPPLDVDGRLDAPVAALHVGHVFQRVREEDPKDHERIDDGHGAPSGTVTRYPKS